MEFANLIFGIVAFIIIALAIARIDFEKDEKKEN